MTSSSKVRAIETLVRWRGLEESRASIAYLHASLAVVQSVDRLEEAQSMLEQIQSHRIGLLRAEEMDLAGLHVSSDIENAAWSRMDECSQELNQAKKRQELASGTYVRARAQTRVAESRHTRVFTQESERQEKALFDWMSDLHPSTRSRT